MTFVEVVDTAVKIGLGALLSGLSAYWVTKRKAHDDLMRERLNRHHDLLEKAAEQIEKFSHLVLRYWALMVELARLRQSGKDFSAEKMDEVSLTKKELFEAYSALTSAEAKLLLLGHKGAQGLLRSYGEIGKRMRREFWEGNSKLEEASLEAIRAELLEAREALFNEISKAYRRVT